MCTFGYETAAESEGFGRRYTESYKGLLTGTLTAQLNSSPTTYLCSVMYYDSYGRLIQSKRKHIHAATGKTTQVEFYNYAYDHAGRLLTATHQLNANPRITLVDNEYDELGRLKANKRNGHSNLKTNYNYTVRSWTKSITSPLFRQTLYYQDANINHTNTPCYDGDISAMEWVATDQTERGYDFDYDQLSRLTASDYLESRARSNKFSTSYRYDKQGNVLSLNRRGNSGTTTYGVIDELSLTYRGNQLLKVDDAAINPTLSMSLDFKDGARQEIEYDYDANGNQVKDLNKGISKIEYNVLNLPKKVTFTGVNNPTTTYAYSAGGDKLNVIHKSSIEKRTDYVGAMIYENGSLKRILVDGGYIENGIYHFFLQDHQGNNRVVAKADGAVIQTNHYYPYGMPFAESTYTDKQPYKYNGEELDTEYGLNLYDYGARYTDTVLRRFKTPDPLSEKYYSMSPFGYCGNNLINRIDPTGMSFDWFQHGDELIWRASMDKTITEGGKSYNNIGSTASIANEDGIFSNFYQNVGFRSDQPFNAFNHIMDNGIQGKYMSESSGLWEQGKVNLMKATVAQGREDFLNHPVTQGGINFTLFLATGGIEGIEGIAGIVRSMAKSAAKASSRAFFSGAGTEVRALNEGFTTLSQTRAGKNLMKMTEEMPYYPGSQAYNWWARLSSTYAKGVPKGSNVNVFLNNPSPTGIWNAVEKPILQQRRINIIYR